jgi:hypothetical protein
MREAIRGTMHSFPLLPLLHRPRVGATRVEERRTGSLAKLGHQLRELALLARAPPSRSRQVGRAQLSRTPATSPATIVVSRATSKPNAPLNPSVSTAIRSDTCRPCVLCSIGCQTLSGQDLAAVNRDSSDVRFKRRSYSLMPVTQLCS